MTTDLIPKQINPVKLFSENGLEPVLNEIKIKADEFLETASLETSSGRKEIASFARTIASSKVFLDDLGKKLVEDRKAEIKLVDNERKRARDFLDSERDRVRKPLTDWEAAEAEKEELRRKEAAFLMDWDEALQMDDLFNREREIKIKEAEFARIEAESKAKAEANRIEKERIAREEQIRKEAAEAAEREAAEKEKKRLDDSGNARVEILKKIGVSLDFQTCRSMTEQSFSNFFEEKNSEYQIEQNRLFVEKMKAEKEESARLAAEAKAQAERDKIAAEERAKLEAERAEQARIEALKQAEADKQAAIKKAKEDAELEAKVKKQADEQEAARLKKIADDKAANKAHQAKINNVILSSLMSVCGLPEIGAKAIIEAVAKGKIPGMKIIY